MHNRFKYTLTCGIPPMLWHASICCITSGRDGAAKTIFPVGTKVILIFVEKFKHSTQKSR